MTAPRIWQVPCAPQRFAALPILLPNANDRPAGFNKSVAFPCGAFQSDGRWIISYGYHDQECRVALFAAAEVERRLRPV